ncbi:hypothetical protein FN846DRAFT_915140 [Sphaerosporella brunnea]|uniref:Uncharacterized protein n=1 Tax=Sphaerosporella brunnea TaxID=1250544 RepID=A0A5J5EBG8_9PEZI|nr:hypothetical protein FN846DRAFT_915140 [Sphaerosporella brunnea]
MSAPINCRPEARVGFDITPNFHTVRSEQSILLELYARTFGIQVPPLKFVVPGDNRIYFIPSEYVKTYGDMKMAVADKLQIDVDGVLDMSLDRSQPSEWQSVSSAWPYCFGKFTVIGQAMFADPILTVVWK